MAINCGVALHLLSALLAQHPSLTYLAALAGIASGMVFNLRGNRYVVFCRRHIRD